MIACGSCGKENPDDRYFCGACGSRLVSTAPLSERERDAGIAGLRGAVQRLVDARRAESAPFGALSPALRPRAVTPIAPALPPRTMTPTVQALPRPVSGPARLVAVREDGSDGATHPLGDGSVDLGRTEGDHLFDDPLLAARHAHFARGPEGRVVRALEGHNGVFRRLRAPAELMSGDRLIIGEQLFRFELVSDAERVATYAAVENGVAVFGSQVRPAWGRLMQLAGGVVRDVFHLARGEVLIGSERTDVVIPHDARVSPTHARITMRGGRVMLEDQRSAAGTFVSVRGAYTLDPGDVIRVGGQLFRFEGS